MTQRISVYEANRQLDESFGGGVWIQFHDGDAGEDGTDNVIDGIDRVFVENFDPAAGKEIVNSNNVDVDDLPACSISGFSAWDAEEDGNFKRSCRRLEGSPRVVTPKAISAGDSIRIPPGGLVFSFENIT